MADLIALKTELDTDPLARGYAGMTDAQAATDLNLFNRPGPPSPNALLQHLTLERFRTGTLYGRLKLVAEARPVKDGANWTIPPVPIGVAEANIIIDQKHISAAQTLLRFVDTDSPLTVSLLDDRLNVILDVLSPTTGCEAIGGGDKAAIRALSQNRQSRAQELNLGLVREGEVTQARAL